jgi:hypothetical protein
MFHAFRIIAYFSPETMLPLSSLIATIAGFALLLKRSSIRFIVGCCRAALRTRRPGAGSGEPHFAGRARRSSRVTRSGRADDDR